MPYSEQQLYFPTSTHLEDRQNAQPLEGSATQSNSLFARSQDYPARSRPSNSISGLHPDASYCSAITRYLEDDGDSSLPRHLATQYRLLGSATTSFRRPAAGTSMLLSGNNSLAALTTASSASTLPSVSSSMGERYLGPSRILEIDHQGALMVAPLRQKVVFECPFNFLHCLCTFTSFSEWFSHSLSHFGRVPPPPMNKCCLCDVIFDQNDGMESWRTKMEHTAVHHQLGHKLAHARPDFKLYNYLWKTQLIGTHDYKELVAGNSASRSSLATPEKDSDVAYTSTHGPRHDRKRRARQ